MCNCKTFLNNVQKFDPTRTKTIRNKFVSDVNRRYKRVKQITKIAIVDMDVLGLEPQQNIFTNAADQSDVGLQPGAFRFKTDPEKIAEFQAWLKEMTEKEIIDVYEGSPIGNNPWSDQYIGSAYKKGISRAQTEMKKAGISGLASRPGIDAAFLTPIHSERVATLYTRAFEELKGNVARLNQKAMRSLRDSLSLGIAEGRGLNDIANDLVKVVDLEQNYARTVARTEVIRAHHQASMLEYEEAGVVGVKVRAEWSTAGFNVCFPAGTKVITDKGKISIEEIKPNDIVETRKGKRKVLRTHRRWYTSDVVSVRHSLGQTTATPEHPFYVIGKGWVYARSLRKGDVLKSLQDETSTVLEVSDICISDSAHGNTKRVKKGVLCLVSRLSLRVPILSVHLQSNAEIWQKEIDKISPELLLTNKLAGGPFKSFSGKLFKRCFPGVFSIARKGTKYSRLFGAFAKRFATLLAFNKDGRASACFRTIMTLKPSGFLGIGIIKQFAATFTRNISSPKMFLGSCLWSTGFAVYFWKSFLCGEGFSTFSAHLLYGVMFLFMFIITLSTAEFFIKSTFSNIKRLSAFFANLFLSLLCAVVIALTRAISIFRFDLASDRERELTITTNIFKHNLSFRFILCYLSYSLLKKSKGIYVYNLDVEEIPEYYANDILVHNCPDCLDLEGRVFEIKEITNLIPLHPNCLVSPDDLISIENGEERPISEIKIGDKVLTHTGNYRKVTKVHYIPNQYTEIIVIGTISRILKVTPEHPVLVNKEWKAAKEIKLYDEVYIQTHYMTPWNRKKIGFFDFQVQKLFLTRDKVDLWNLSVEKDESFVANGFVVHNCRCVAIPFQEGDTSAKYDPTIIGDEYRRKDGSAPLRGLFADKADFPKPKRIN